MSDPESRIPQLREADINGKADTYAGFTALWAKFVSNVSLTWPWAKISGAPASFTPSAHAASHAAGGTDPITPASIGTETTAELNARDTANRARANHTGTQLAATISDFSTAADARITAAIDIDGTLAANSDAKIASQKATKTYADAGDNATRLATVSRVAKAKRYAGTPLWDDFDRADAPLGGSTLPSGQTWTTTGDGQTTVVIENGRVFEPNGLNWYGFSDLGAAIPEAHAAFSLNSETDGTAFVLHIAAGTDLLNMLHLQVSRAAWSLDKRIAGVWSNSIATRARGLSLGSVYSCGIRISGTTVTVVDVDGTETSVEVADIAGMGTLRYLGIQGAVCHGVTVGPTSAHALTGFGGGSGAAYEVATRSRLGMRKQQKEITLTGAGWVRVATQTGGNDFGTFAMGGRVRFWAKDETYSNISEFELFTEFTGTPALRLISAMSRFGGSVTQARVSCNAGTGDIALDLYFARASATTVLVEFEGAFLLVTTPAVGATALPSASTVLDLISDDFSAKTPSSRTISGGGLVTGGGDLSANRTLTVTKSTAAQVITGTDDATAVTPLGNKAALDARFNSWVRDTGYIYSDGTTSNRAQIQIPGPRGNLAGAALAEWCGWVLVPSSTPASTVFVAHVGGSTSSVTQADAWFNSIFWDTSDSLRIRANGASSSDWRWFDASGLRATFSGQKIWLEVLFTSGTGNPVVRINGVDSSASFTAANAGTPPDWLSSSLNSTYHLTGYNWPAGEAPLGCWINGHLTQSESDDWRTKGKIPAWVAAGGSMAGLLPNSDFSLDPTVAANGRWTLDAGVTWDAGDTQLDFAGTGIFARSSDSVSDAWRTALNKLGLVFRVTFTISNYVSGSIRIGDSGASALNLRAGGTIANITANGTYSYEVIPGATRFLIGCFDAGSFSVSDFQWIPVGALSLPSVQPIPVLDDVTGIGGNPARLVGMVPVTDKTDWRISANTATNGNEQLLGGAILDPVHDVIEFMEQIPLADSTTTIGSSSGGSQYKASSIVYVAIQPTTLVTREVTSSSVWVGSNTSAVIRTTIKGHRAY